MKIKRLISFKTLEKYKYFYFAINSLVLSVLLVFWIELFVNNTSSNLSIKYFMHNLFFYWGFMYPVSFVVYEATKKQNKKRQEK
jgi:hypothetical protein